jgi:iron complex transport system substrate-binding protein
LIRVRCQSVVFALIALALCLPGCADTAVPVGGGVISLAPHLTEVVFALGQGDRLVGRGAYDDYPPEVVNIENIGGYLDPNLERIALLKPALLLLPGAHKQVADFAALNQIPAVAWNMDSFASIAEGITKIGDALGCPAEATALNARMAQQRDALAAKLAGVKRVKVLIITQRDTHDVSTLYTAGGTSFVSEMVALAGGDNLYAATEQPYLEASKETVVAGAPDVILEFHPGQAMTDKQQQAFINDWQALRELPAVSNYRVYLIDESHALRPGPRIMEIAERIARRLHPDLEWGP